MEHADASQQDVGAGGHANFAAATKAMTGVLAKRFTPIARNAKIYEQLYQL